MMMEDDEVLLEFNERNKGAENGNNNDISKESNLFTFIKNIIIENVT
jgi:hypothetical protein